MRPKKIKRYELPYNERVKSSGAIRLTSGCNLFLFFYSLCWNLKDFVVEDTLSNITIVQRGPQAFDSCVS